MNNRATDSYGTLIADAYFHRQEKATSYWRRRFIVAVALLLAGSADHGAASDSGVRVRRTIPDIAYNPPTVRPAPLPDNKHVTVTKPSEFQVPSGGPVLNEDIARKLSALKKQERELWLQRQHFLTRLRDAEENAGEVDVSDDLMRLREKADVLRQERVVIEGEIKERALNRLNRAPVMSGTIPEGGKQ